MWQLATRQLSETKSAGGWYLCLYFVIPVDLEFVVNWLRHDDFGSDPGAWLAVALAIPVLFALSVGLIRLVFWLVKRKRNFNESEEESARDYWRIHGE
jgi:hypothetical protein